MTKELKRFKLGIKLGECLVEEFPNVKHYHLVTEVQDSDTFTRGLIQALNLQGKEASVSCLWAAYNKKIDTLNFTRKYLEPYPGGKTSKVVILSPTANKLFISSALKELNLNKKKSILVGSVSKNKKVVREIERENSDYNFELLSLKKNTYPDSVPVKVSKLVQERRTLINS